MNHDEVWAEIPGHPKYEASTHGRIRRGGRVLKPLLNKPLPAGRYAVSLWGPGKGRRFFVHRLVLMAFNPAPVPGLYGLHTDGDPTNNRLSNLRWGTQSENMQDAMRHGTHYRKLSRADYAEIRRLRATGAISNVRLAKLYGVSTTTVWAIVKCCRGFPGPESP